MLRNTVSTYGSVSKFLHWLLFILLAGLVITGLGEDVFGESLESVVMGLHKAVGVVVLLLVVVRILWRFANPSPALPATAAAWENLLARLTHFALYVLMLAQPLTGVLMAQFKGRAIDVFGLFSIPALVAKDKATSHFFEELHEGGWILLTVLVGLHVAAALYHHFVRRDDVLLRMTRG
jgi:cytochrome b561